MSPPSTAETPVRSANVVLVVEDDEPMSRMVASILREAGYHVLVAKDTNDAFRVAHEQGPEGLDAVVTDVMMPGMDGRDLARWMKGAYPKVKILFISGQPNHSLDQPGVLKPGTAFLRKPFDRQELTAKLGDLLAG